MVLQYSLSDRMFSRFAIKYQLLVNRNMHSPCHFPLQKCSNFSVEENGVLRLKGNLDNPKKLRDLRYWKVAWLSILLCMISSFVHVSSLKPQKAFDCSGRYYLILINPSAGELIFIGKPEYLSQRFSDRRKDYLI